MTFKEIRQYARETARTFAVRTADGRNVEALAVERAVMEKCTQHLGGAHHPERKQQYLAKRFVLECRKRGLSTQVIHFAKNGEVR